MVDRDNRPREACKGFGPDLVFYYYGECPETERGRVETHLKGCASCRYFLEDLGRLLPLTLKPDEPPQVFWESYSREMQRRLASAQRNPWWRDPFSLFRPWPVPALATALLLILALTLTFTKRFWRPEEPPPVEETLLEIAPAAENLEFFKAMDFLESMDLLEALEGTGSRNGAV